MTQVARHFPHRPDPPATSDALPDAVWRVVRPDVLPADRTAPVSSPAFDPPAPPAGGATAGELQSPLRLARLIATLDAMPGIPDHVRTMSGMTVLREHLAMQSALNGLLRGLIKE